MTGLRSSNSAVEALRAATASAGACIVSHPLDVARVRLQVSANTSNRNTLQTLRHLVSTEGTRALMRGASTAVCYNLLLNSIRFSVFDVLTLSRSNGESSSSVAACGLIAGLVGGVVSSPLAQARTILQGPVGGAACGGSRNPLLSAMQLVRSDPFAGASAWGVRNGGHTSCIFATYELVKYQLSRWAAAVDVTQQQTQQCGAERHEREPLDSHAPSLAICALSSLIASTISCVVMHPVELSCTRFFHLRLRGQTDGTPTHLSQHLSSPLRVASHILRTDGYVGLYKGLGASTLRMVPHTTVTFILIEGMRRLALC